MAERKNTEKEGYEANPLILLLSVLLLVCPFVRASRYVRPKVPSVSLCVCVTVQIVSAASFKGDGDVQ